MRAILYADGASRGNPGPSGAGAVLIDEDGHILAELTQYLGTTTNNVAEYSAFILGLEEALRRGVDDLDVRMDSKLVVEQIAGRWKVKHPNMKPLALKAGALFASFPKRKIAHVPRDANTIADALSNRAIDEAT
ncbi:MAG TPA: reverse transcriptase-like protein [Candidatus Limnocylindrales bacterium]|nr:reverse transcriptase-like protein [Candidatus Limnocylindrales bacterium]